LHARLVLVVRGHALQAADGDGLGLLLVVLLDAPAPARRLARAVAGAAEDSREHVRAPVDHEGIVVPAGGDQTDVFGDGGVGRASPLTIDYFENVVGASNIGRLQCNDLQRAAFVFLCASGVAEIIPPPGVPE